MNKLDTIWKYLGIAWSIIAFVAVAAFFFGGQWTTWNKMRQSYEACVERMGSCFSAPDLTEYVKKSEILATLDLTGYAKKSEIVPAADLSEYVKKFDIPPADSIVTYGSDIKMKLSGLNPQKFLVIGSDGFTLVAGTENTTTLEFLK